MVGSCPPSPTIACNGGAQPEAEFMSASGRVSSRRKRHHQRRRRINQRLRKHKKPSGRGISSHSRTAVQLNRRVQGIVIHRKTLLRAYFTPDGMNTRILLADGHSPPLRASQKPQTRPASAARDLEKPTRAPPYAPFDTADCLLAIRAAAENLTCSG